MMPATSLSPAGAGAVEFWFDFGSPYAYLSTMRIEEAAVRTGVRLHWKPFLLGPVFAALGWATAPFVLQSAKREYMWKDLARQSRKYGVPWRQPSSFPRSAVLPLRVALLGAESDWIGAFCREIMRQNFADDRHIDSPALVAEVLETLDLPASLIIDEALSEANKAALRTQTEAAKVRGIFGAPTYFVGTEMFWGNDRLEDALSHAIHEGRAGRCS